MEHVPEGEGQKHLRIWIHYPGSIVHLRDRIEHDSPIKLGSSGQEWAERTTQRTREIWSEKE